MIIELRRSGKIISEVIAVDKPPMYAGTILIHEVAVRVKLYEGELLAVSYSNVNAEGTAKPITSAQIFTNRRAYNDSGGAEWYAPLPNAVMTAGDKKASIFIMDVFSPEAAETKYKIITAADVPFTVYDSCAFTDFEPVDEPTIVYLQRQLDEIHNLTLPPDVREAGQVGIPTVSITADGRLKFSQLKGERGMTGAAGANAVIQWGLHESAFSNIEWRKA